MWGRVPDMCAALAIRLFGIVGLLLPRPVLLLVGRWIGNIAYLVAFRRRRLALENIRLAFGEEMPPKEQGRVARRSFAHLGMNLMEYFTFPYLTQGKIRRMTRISGEEHLESALGKGKGVICLTGHMGNWDLLGTALAFRGYPVSLVSKISRSRAINRVWMDYRENVGVRIFSGDGAMKDILRQLKGNRIVGLVVDQNALGKDGIFVPFFGRDACTLTTPAVLARRTGASVVPIFSYREGSALKIVVEAPLESEDIEDIREDTVQKTLRYSEWTEAVIRRHPEQWTWLHNRWRTRPPGEVSS